MSEYDKDIERAGGSGGYDITGGTGRQWRPGTSVPMDSDLAAKNAPTKYNRVTPTQDARVASSTAVETDDRRSSSRPDEARTKRTDQTVPPATTEPSGTHPSTAMAGEEKRLERIAKYHDGGYHMSESSVKEGIGCCGYCLTALSWIIIALTFPFSLCLCLKVVQEYERAVIFRLGRLLPGGAKGPGLFFVIPCTDSYTKVDLRTVSFDVPPQEILSKDSVTVAVDAVVYYRVQNATISITNVEDANRSTRLLAQTTLRNVLGTKNLSDILSEREAISQFMQESLDEATDPWGVKVERVEIKDVRLPVQLQRAMAAEAEATREARAKVIAAEGEHKASRALREAADIINESPSALQLRYLQTLNSISAEKNSTIIFPLPIDMLRGFMKT